MTDEQMKRNVAQLFHVLSFTPKERPEDPVPYEDPAPSKPCKAWDYEFAYKDMKHPQMVLDWCKKHGHTPHKRERGIFVRQLSNNEINEVRRKCNKSTKAYPIQLAI